MLKRLLLGIGVTAVSFASTQNYNITLSEHYAVGATHLKPGDYRMVINGANAMLEDSHNKVVANGSIENKADKYKSTAIVSTTVKGEPHLEAIELGGTRYEIRFN
jgi:hypothetical protein